MKRLFWCVALLTGALGAPSVLAQPVSVTWPLTSGTGWTSSAPALVTGNPEVVMGGGQLTVFDYWSGQAQRLWAGTSGWAAAPANPGRYLQFDALPTPGNQLSVTSVSFKHGGAGIAGHVVAEVRYSVNNWATSTLLVPAVPYPHPAMVPFSMAISPLPPAVASGGKFSLRIYPYTVVDSIAGSPTFAAHNSVVINGNSAPGGGGPGSAKASFEIRKSTGGAMVAGSYAFTVSCIGPGGPYTGTNPVYVTLPTPGMTSVSVPSGSICGIVETQPTNGTWSPPVVSGSGGLAVEGGAPWSAKFGPVTGSGGVVHVTNRQTSKEDPKGVRFDIRKKIDGPMVAGNYNFTVTCNGPGGPYGPIPVSVTLPSPGFTSVTVPAGSNCGIVETPPATGSWSAPLFSGSGLALQSGGAWNAKVGPLTASGGTVNVTNRRGKDDPKLVPFVIRKAISGPMVAGTYDFMVTCNGPGGSFGPTLVSITLPMPGMSTVGVPAGSVCGIVETPPATGSWLPPTVSGNGVAVMMGAPWNAKVGPIGASGGTVTVVNRPKEDPKGVQFNIRKTINGPMVAGSYDFTVTCNGPGGPYTGPNPVSITMPIPGMKPVTVPPGSTCTIVEAQPATGSWSPPTFTGTGMALVAGPSWTAQVGPITGPGGSVVVTNNPTVSTASCPAYVVTQNLNVGAMINSTNLGNLNQQTNNGTVEKYCYGDTLGNCNTYGGLYEWNEAMGYAAGNNNDLTGARVQGICPAGFHIPSDLEWARYAWCQESSVAPTGPTPLATFQDQSNFTWMGSATPGVGPGEKMKVAFGAFTPAWTGTHASGFGALPAGSRTMSVGTYANLGDFTAYWTSTPSTATKARYFALDSPSSSGRIGRNIALNAYGLSVRCMKDY